MFEIWLVLFSAIVTYIWLEDMTYNRNDPWLFGVLAAISLVIAPELLSTDISPELPSLAYEKVWSTLWIALTGMFLHLVAPDKITRSHVLLFAVSGFIIGFAVSIIAMAFFALAYFTNRHFQRRRVEIYEALGHDPSGININPIISALSATLLISLFLEISFKDLLAKLYSGEGEFVFPPPMPDETGFLLIGLVPGAAACFLLERLRTRRR